MAYTDINPDVVAEIANMVNETLSQLNEDFDQFQSQVFNKIQESWYNENAIKVMPGAVSAMSSVNAGVNTSLESLGKALGGAANTWASANGAAGYAIGSVAAAILKMACDVVDNKNGFRGMDVDEIQTAVSAAETIKGTMIGRLNKLEAAGQREGFRGGNMQAQLQSVCDQLKSQIEKAFNEVIDNITSNTGTAKSNVESARSTTESTFTIS